MPLSLPKGFPIARLFRQLELDVETVVKVLQPGPLGIIEHKFTDEEVKRASSTVEKAVKGWRSTAYMQRTNPFLKDFIDTERVKFYF